MKSKLITALIVLVMTLSFLTGTASANYYTDSALLRQGSTGTYVTQLQNDLRKLGYFNRSSTGYYGSITTDAVRRYQASKGLSTRTLSTSGSVTTSRGSLDRLAVDGVVGPVTARSIKVDNILEFSQRFIGVPYLWGGTSPSGFDCSGFTHYVFLKNGITIPRTAAQQYADGISVSRSQLKPGDLVFYTTYKPGPSHVGIYMGANRFIHASSSKGVTITDMSNSYYAPRYIGARRVVE